jgi:hypothetical protein
MKVCIIGAGVSGIILILLLVKQNVNPKSIICVDPYFDGGHIVRQWGMVLSNTEWSKTLGAVKKYLPEYPIPQWAETLPSNEPTPLHKIGQLFREISAPVMKQIHTIHGKVKSAHRNTNQWSLNIQREQEMLSIDADILYHTYGSQPKHLDLPVQTIPLNVALQAPLLSSYIKSTDKVVVFGLHHSGVLVVKNLIDSGITSITGIYRGKEPFLFAKDGHYDGLKLATADIAKDLLEGKYPQFKHVHYNNLSSLVREIHTADWVVYAIGFEHSNDIVFHINDKIYTHLTYDSKTGKIHELPQSWGFGIAYPNQAPDGIHWDIGISPFFEHIHAQIQCIPHIE